MSLIRKPRILVEEEKLNTIIRLMYSHITRKIADATSQLSNYYNCIKKDTKFKTIIFFIKYRKL